MTMEILNLPEELDVLQFLETDDCDLAASFLGLKRDDVRFIKTMEKEDDIPKLLEGIMIEDFLKEKILELNQEYRIIRISLPYELVMEFSMESNLDQAYGTIMDELMKRKEALCTFPIEYYDYRRGVFRLGLAVLHD